MSKHTPAPWVERAYLIETIGGRRIAHVNAEHVHDGEPARSVLIEEDDANASLIAAAPELLTELKHLVNLMQSYEYSGELSIPGLATLNGARAAIAKAEGII